MGLLIQRVKLVFANAADWAFPFFGQVIKRCAWGDAVSRIAFGWVINVSAWITLKLLHVYSPFVVWLKCKYDYATA